jgi:EmrB/QacA subfamily drug resistance transporter
MLGISFVIMLVALDQTVVGTALPTIVAELRGFDLYAWVATSYLLTSVVTIPLFGRLGDYFGRKPFLVASIVVFTLASALCGAAGSMLFLVLGRGLQGIGGGMLIGTAFASVPDLFPEPKVRLRWQVMLSSAFGIANAIGPSLGGFLTQYYGWRSVFYVNLPVGALSLFFVWRFLPHLRHAPRNGATRIDWFGAALIAVALGCAQLFVELLPGAGVSTGTAALLAASVAAFAILWRHERGAANPILPLDMFRDPRLAPLFMLSLLQGLTMFALLFYAPLLFQGGFGLEPRDAGLLITPLVVCITIGSIANGRIVTRLRVPNVMLTIGFTLLTLCAVGIIATSRTMPHLVVIVCMTLGGLGLGLIMPNLMIFAQQGAGRGHLGIATALLQSLRMVGGMIGTAVTGTLVTHVYRSGVHAALDTADAMPWFARFADPQILVGHRSQAALIAQLDAAGRNGARLLDLARDALVGAIHLGLVVSVLMAGLGIWYSRRVPPVKLGRLPELPITPE